MQHSPIRIAFVLLFMTVTLTSCSESPWTEQTAADARDELVRRYLTRGLFNRTPVQDENVLRAIRTVPRHRFVPRDIEPHAYEDRALPIGLDQTISQPYIVAIMTEALQLDADDIVLEVGTGSGYQAAVLAELVEEVYSVEIIARLSWRARRTLGQLGYTNVHMRVGDGYKGWPEQAPFDGIIVTAAPEHIPQPLIDQLKPGGRMVIPIGPEGRIQKLQLLEKTEDGKIQESTLDLVRFVPMTGEAEKKD